MSYPTITKAQMAEFTGRPAVSFPPFVESSALPQALLLFKIGTCLASLSDLTTEEQQLALFGIMSMADAIHLSQPYAAAAASPFSSESIGSYSYSKTAKAVTKGETTGITWFDLAIKNLSVCDTEDDLPMSGGIEVFENDARFVQGATQGNFRMLSPQDMDSSRAYGFDPAASSIYGG